MTFADSDLTEDGFLGGRLRILQPRAGYRAAMDPVLLGAAVPARPGQSVLELGCGAGVAALCLAARIPSLEIVGLELQPSYADLARRNASANDAALTVIDGDLAPLPEALRHRSFDHVIANPPYFPPGAGTPAHDAGRERAHREATPLPLWISVAFRHLIPRGTLTVIQSADRLPDLLAALPASAGSVTVLPVQPRESRPARRIILRARKGGRGAFTLAPPFVIHEGPAHMRDGDDHTLAARLVLRDGAALPF